MGLPFAILRDDEREILAYEFIYHYRKLAVEKQMVWGIASIPSNSA